MYPFARCIAVSAIALLGLSACSRSTSLPATASNAGDQPANFSLVTDIPIPANASMDTERSLILSDRDRWTGRVVMKLPQTPVEMTTFYQQQMPPFGWVPVMSVTSGVTILTYTRGDRAATVQIERATVYGCTVLVTVAPRQADPAMDAPPVRSAPSERIRSESLPPPSRR
jgi:hypothetical protein